MSAPINRQWTVTIVPVGTAGGTATRRITAAYITGDAALPGWVVFKDADHKTVYQVRSDIAVDIQRDDEPTADIPRGTAP